MISVMNRNNYELDRTGDVVKGELGAEPRVSSNDVVVVENSSEAPGGGHSGVCSAGSVQSDELRVCNAGIADTPVKVSHGGRNERMSFELMDSEDIRVSDELDNRALDCEYVDVPGNQVSQEMEFRVRKIRNEDFTARASSEELSKQYSGSHHSESDFEADEFIYRENEYSKLIPRASDIKVDDQNGKVEHPGSSTTVELLEVGKPSVSDYDFMLSMFDDFAANGRELVRLDGSSKHVGYGYQVGDMVWGKVKSHPWWPGHIYNESFATSSVRRSKREGFILVAFFGDSSYGWFDPAELIPFDLNFYEKSRQTNSRTFVKAVEEAVDEASRRCGLGLACRCRNPYNFRPTDVEGYFAVDVGDFELGGVYSASQIKKARDNFQPKEILSFVKQLASAPTIGDRGGINFTKNKATVLAYRKAVYEEFDETYAQAFGFQPMRSSREQKEAAVSQPSIESARAPLSGPLVIAEALGESKTGKAIKGKDQVKRERYLFKRRDELNEFKSPLINSGQASPSTHPVCVEGSSMFADGDFILQKRDPAVSVKSDIPSKLGQVKNAVWESVSASSQDVTGKQPVIMDGKHAVGKHSMTGTQKSVNKVESVTSSSISQGPGYSSHLIEAKSSVDKEKYAMEMKESLLSDVAVDSTSMGGGSIPGKGQYTHVDAIYLPYELGVNEGYPQPPSQPATFEPSKRVEHDQNGRGIPDVSVPTNVKIHGDSSQIHAESGAKKAKVRKQPVGTSSNEKSVVLEKKKKRRKKDLGGEMGPEHMARRAAVGKGGQLVGKVAGHSKQVALPLREDVQADYQKSDTGACTSLFPNSVGTRHMAGIGNIDIELPQLLNDLQALALDPFHGSERGPAIICQVFLRFRALVYQKSLASSPAAESELNDIRASKSSYVTKDSDNLPIENIPDHKALKVPKALVRHDDPTKGGRKRSPSDRQEEMAVRKKKKINDLKLLAAERKASQKTPEAHRDAKDAAIQMQPKQRSEFPKKLERSPRVPDPTMLVMKFPPQGTLPSLSELKARFARFGQMDHSATRIFWKTSTCRVVYRYKLDAEAAYKFSVGSNNLFGNADVRCYMRELGVSGTESESSGKFQREDTSLGAPQLRDAEQKVAAPLALQSLQQPAIQLKSCLKKPNGDDSGPATGGNGGSKGTPRVKFMLGGEDSSREQLMVGSKNYYNNNASSFADGGASSSITTSHGMDVSKNFQMVIPTASSAPNLPNLPLATTAAAAQFLKVANNMHYTEEVAPAPLRNVHVSSTISTVALSTTATTSSSTNIDIAQQMLNLLTKCNDVVANVTGMLGYVPYHPL